MMKRNLVTNTMETSTHRESYPPTSLRGKYGVNDSVSEMFDVSLLYGPINALLMTTVKRK